MPSIHVKILLHPFDTTLHIRHAEKYGLCKKKKIYPCPEVWKEKSEKKKDSPYLKREIKGRVVQKEVRVSSTKVHTHAHLDLIV